MNLGARSLSQVNGLDLEPMGLIGEGPRSSLKQHQMTAGERILAGDSTVP